MIRYAASASHADVTAKITEAVSGDVVDVPAGDVTYTSQLSIPTGKNITLRGAGIGVTTISSALSTCLHVNKTSSRVTGFTFKHTSSITSNFVIQARGRGFRIDHCRVESTTGVKKYGIYATGGTGFPTPRGLVDHCEFFNVRNVVLGDLAITPEVASEAWDEPLDLGTDKAVYFEDCIFQLTVFGNVIDENYGGKYVARYCDFIDCYPEVHSAMGGNRGSRGFEIYENTIRRVNTSLSVYYTMLIRAGTGVVFNNTITGAFGSGGIISLDNRRTNPNDGDSSYGGSPQDGNAALSNGSGTHDAATSGTVLTDTTKAWTVNGFKVMKTKVTPNVERWFYVYNLTDGSKGRITANTATTVTVSALTGGEDNTWESGDSYKISDGYPARDQIGRSDDAFLWTAATPYPSQALDPAYFWNNMTNGSPTQVVVVNASGRHIQSGRDFFANAGTKPGYTELDYPHPLTATDITLSGDLAFGDLEVSETSDKTFTIANNTASTRTVSDINFPAGYSLDWTSGTIPANDSQIVTVTFEPVDDVEYSGTITVEHDGAEESSTILVSGTGIEVPTPEIPKGVSRNAARAREIGLVGARRI